MGTANVFATPTSIVASGGTTFNPFLREKDVLRMSSRDGDVEGLEWCSREGRIMSGLVNVGEDESGGLAMYSRVGVCMRG